MLTMTVMQQEGGSGTQFNTEAAEVKDVSLRLRHLHNILQECHMRVQLVDHALFAQDDKDHNVLQNAGKDYNSEIKSKTDINIQNQIEENCSHQLGIGENCNLQKKNGKDDRHEEFRKIIKIEEQLGAFGLQNQLQEDLNVGIEEQRNKSSEDYNQQIPAKEKYSFLDGTTKDQKSSVTSENSNIQDVYNDTQKIVVCSSEGNYPSNITMNDFILQNCIRKEDLIHIEMKKENDFHNILKNTNEPDNTKSLETKPNKYLKRQECVTCEDFLPTDTTDISNANRLSDCSDSNEVTILPTSSATTDVSDNHFQLTNLSKQKTMQKCHHLGEIRNRSDSIHVFEKDISCERNVEFNKNSEKDYIFEDNQERSREVGRCKDIGSLSLVSPDPDVVFKMAIIWEALENLQSNIHALHSSLIDSSNIFDTQESANSSNNYFSSINENDKGTKCGKFNVMHEDITDETVHLYQSPREQSFKSKPQLGNHPQCVCQNLSKNKIGLHTSTEKQTSSAALNGCWKSCFFMMTIVLFILLLLFSASCLLLVFPIVRVSVRTAGGLPAY